MDLEKLAQEAAAGIYDAIFLLPTRNDINRMDAIADGLKVYGQRAVAEAREESLKLACEAVRGALKNSWAVNAAWDEIAEQAIRRAFAEPK